ncbi:unnamed protein product [Hermetia illucens]|uniref:Uncharacterized protein n=1 Tax=Hermetia illucens TaxID=343691 RepID=A0A7R8V0Y3_HERIL|nr:unnamed protein product [Hermetia illucens]
MDLLLLSPPKSQQPEQLRHVAAGTLGDPCQLANDLQLSDDSDSEESSSVGKPEQTVKGSFCLIKHISLLGDSTGQPPAVGNIRDLYQLANDLQLSDDSDSEESISVGKPEQTVKGSFCPIKHMPLLGDSTGQPPAVGTIRDPYQLANDPQLSDDSDSEESSSVGKPEQTVKGSFCPIKHMPLLGDSTGQPPAVGTIRDPYQLANDLQLSDDSDSEESVSVGKPEQTVKGSFCPIKHMPLLGDSAGQPPAVGTIRDPYQLANDPQLSDDSDSEESISVGKLEQTVKDSFWPIKHMPLLGDSTGQPSAVGTIRDPYQLANNLQLSDDSDSEESFSVGKPEQTVKGSPPKHMPLLGDSSEEPPAVLNNPKPWNKNLHSNGQTIARKGEDNFRSYHLADDLQLSDDSDFEDVSVKPKQVSDPFRKEIPLVNPGTVAIRGANEEDVRKQVGSCLPTLQYFNGIITGNGSYSLVNDLELSEDSDSDNVFGAGRPKQVSVSRSSRAENKSVLNIGDPFHAPIKRMPEEFVKGEVNVMALSEDSDSHNAFGAVQPEQESAEKGLSQSESFRKSIGMPSSALQHSQEKKIISSKLVKPVADSTVKLAPAFGDTKADGRTIQTKPLHRIHSEEQRAQGLSKHEVTLDMTGHNPQKVDTTANIEMYNGRRTTKPIKVAAVLPSGSRSEPKSSNPSLDPLPENFTLPVARKVRTSKFSKQEIENQISRGKELLQKKSENNVNCEGQSQSNGRRGKNMSNSELPSKKAAANISEEPDGRKQNIFKEIGRLVADSEKIQPKTTKPNKRDEHEKRASKGSENEALISCGKEKKRNSANESKLPEHNTSEQKGGLSKVSEAFQKKPVSPRESVRSSDLINKTEANRDGKTERRRKKSPNVHNKKEGRKGEAHQELLHKMDKAKPHKRNTKEMLGLKSSTVNDEKRREGKTDRRTEKSPNVVHNKNEGRKGEAQKELLHKMDEPKPHKRNAKEMLGSKTSIEKDEKTEGNFTQEPEPPRKKHKKEIKTPMADSKMRISEDGTNDKHERKSSKGSHGENKDIRTEASRSQCKEMPSSKMASKSLKIEETANAPAINEDFKQDPGVKNLSDIDKFKILRQEYIALMELLKKPANLVVELKSVLDQKMISGTTKEVMALKETILIVGRELRSESFQSQKRKLKQLQDQLESLKQSIRNGNTNCTLAF